MNDDLVEREALNTPQPPTLRRLFLGDDGLRAGWSFLLFCLLAAALVFGLSFAAKHLGLLPAPPRGTPRNAPIPFETQAVGEALGALGFLLAAGVMAWIERRPFRRYGLTWRRAVPDFLAGLGWGLLLMSALVGVLYETHHLSFDQVLLHGAAVPINGLKLAGFFLLVGLQEEFITRGYIQFTVARGVAGIARAMDKDFSHTHLVSFWVAAGLFSVMLFMVGHLGNPGESVAGILAVGGAGAVFAYSLWRTGSLWWAIGIHTSWDWAQSFLYGVPDSGTMEEGHLMATHPMGSSLLSGGATGPEGSVLVLPTLALIGAVIYFTLPRRAYFLTPDQMPPRHGND